MNGLQWFQVIVSFALQATLVIGVAWGVERWTVCAAAKARIWSACFVSLIMLLAMGVLLPHLEWMHPWSGLGPKKLLAVAGTQFMLGKCLLAIWACGAGVMVARWVMQFFSVRRFIASCLEYPAEVQERLKSQIPADSAIPHDGQLSFRECPQELGPFCYQFHQPLVFLPIALVNGDATELEHVLRHELMHLKTQHPMQLFAQKLTQIVLWFHPLVWMCGRRSSLVREFICDDAASGDSQSTASYLRTLLRLAESRTASPGGTLMFGRSESELKIRAQRLAFENNQFKASGIGAPALVCMAAFVFSQLWVPTNPFASRHAIYSPWPSWTATVAHAFNVTLRDFETFDAELQINELTAVENHRRSQ